MKHNDNLSAPEPPVGQIRALAPITNALAKALLYSHDPAEHVASRPPDEQFGDWERHVHEQLHRDFFDQIYVERPEIHTIENHLKLQRLVVVIGTRGAGKTTAMLRVAHGFKPHAGLSLHHVNLRDYAARFRNAETKSTVCEIIFSILFDHFLGSDEATKAEWRVFLLRHDPAFESLRQLLMLEVPIQNDAPDADWLQCLEGERYRDAWRDAWTKFSAPDNDGKLETLLQFVSERRNHHSIVMIDNIDRYSIRMQREVMEKLIDLANRRPPFITPVIAVRSGNFQRIDLEGRGDNQFFVVKLRPPTHTPYSDAEDLLPQMIRKRFDFVARLDFENHLDQDTLTRLAQNLKYPSRAAFLQRHKEVLGLVQKSLGEQDILELYLKWHNGSLRSAASHIYNLLHAFVTDTDPYFRYSTVTRNPSRAAELLSPRALRSSAYRHLIFGGRRPPASPHTINLFDEPLALSSSAVRFPSLRILEYLGAQPDHSARWGKLVQDLGSFGMSRDEVFHYLSELAHSRGFETDGFVLVDIREEDRNVAMPDRTEVELLPAGLKLCDQIAVSCEYLFWTAMYTDVRFRLIDSSEKIGESDAVDPNRTIVIASRFLCQHIIPAYLEEHKYSGWDHAPTPADLRAFHLNYWTFGRSRSTTRDFFPIRADRSLRAFASSSDVSRETWLPVQRQLDEATAKCRKLWERYGIPA